MNNNSLIPQKKSNKKIWYQCYFQKQTIVVLDNDNKNYAQADAKNCWQGLF